MSADNVNPRYPGIRSALDGNSAVVACERESTDAAGAYPITPSTQMGEGWAEAAADGHINTAGRSLIFIEPEGEHAAAAVTAGLSMTGLRAANFSSGQGIAYMHESLYAAAGKRLTYVLNMGTRAMTKATLNVHAGHDDYHCVDDTGFFQLFAKNVQHVADLNLIAHRVAELALTPGIVAQDGFLTTHVIESLQLPERALIDEFLGYPDDLIESPTPAQSVVYGEHRRRIPELWDVDNPVMAGVVQNQDAFMQSVAAQRPYFYDHIGTLADQAFDEFASLTHRRYARVMSHCCRDAEYLLLGQGSVVPTLEAVADYLRREHRVQVGVIDLVMFRPFPSEQLAPLFEGRKGVTVFERVDQPLAADLPLMREIRSTVSKCLENGRDPKHPGFPTLPIWRHLSDAPALYSASFGLGSRDLQPGDIVAAVDNMRAGSGQRRFFYLGIEFARDKPLTPREAVHQDTLLAEYPHVRDLALPSAENPNLMPAGSISVRFHSIGGWGAITTGKNLASTLFDLLGLHVKANPKYGSEKKGQPTTFFLSAAEEPIRVNSENRYVDVVLSPDPNVFQHTDALAGLREEGVFIIQSDAGSAEAAWRRLPTRYQHAIVDRRIHAFYLDAFRIGREEATDPDLELRMQGIAFQGAFFAATSVMANAGLDERTLLGSMRGQLEHKFGAKGARVVEDNIRAVKRGFDEVRRFGEQAPIETPGRTVNVEPPIPGMVKRLPGSTAPLSDIQRFWSQTGSLYARGQGTNSLADPFIALSQIPASTALFRDMTGIRFQHPEWIAENCTGCGNCVTVCPDTAMPGLVCDLTELLDTALAKTRQAGHEVPHLPRLLRTLERTLREKLRGAQESDSVRGMLNECIRLAVESAPANSDEAEAIKREFAHFQETVGNFDWALTRPYFTLPEKKKPGSGGLFNISINPYTCKGCSECIAVCNDDALRVKVQTPESVAELRHDWNLWLDLPTTPERYIRIPDLEEASGALETLLLDKHNYLGFTGGDGACLGCGEKSVVRLFVATTEALMHKRVEGHVTYIAELVSRLEHHVQMKLVDELDVDQPDLIAQAMSANADGDLTLSSLASSVERSAGSQPIDRAWLARVVGLIAKLKDLHGSYTAGVNGRGRASMGILNSTGCSSVWGSTYPFNPYPVPWANHLFQDSASMAMGIFEGHMVKMADGFKAIRMAELELDARYLPAEHDPFFSRFSWHDFSDEEYRLSPPVVAMGGDGAMYDIGFQNLSRLLMSGKPIKVVVLDTQVYSNTGGQACTSGFTGQVSDMAPFGDAIRGKQEIRKELSLIAIAHRSAYVMQSTIAHPAHMIEGFVQGLQSRRPAVFNLYTPCQPEHGIGDDKAHEQSRLAVEGRAYPLLRFDPDRGPTIGECLDLGSNPARAGIWPEYELRYVEGGQHQSISVAMTFADFAVTENRFRKHFRTVPEDDWHERMVPLAEYLELEPEEREDRYPFIWTVNAREELGRLLVDDTMVASSEDRRDFWLLLRGLVDAAEPAVADPTSEQTIRGEVVSKLMAGLLQLMDEPAPTIVPLALGTSDESAAGKSMPAGREPGSDQASDYAAPWIETEDCTACDECIKLNSDIFAYNEVGKAVIRNPEGGPFEDLVRAAERCTAQIIHPGLPRDRSAPGIERWLRRAEPFS